MNGSDDGSIKYSRPVITPAGLLIVNDMEPESNLPTITGGFVPNPDGSSVSELDPNVPLSVNGPEYGPSAVPETVKSNDPAPLSGHTTLLMSGFPVPGQISANPPGGPHPNTSRVSAGDVP